MLKGEGLQVLFIIVQCIWRNLEYHDPRIAGGKRGQEKEALYWMTLWASCKDYYCVCGTWMKYEYDTSVGL